MRPVAPLAVSVLAAVAGVAMAAGQAPPWTAPGVAPLPAWVTSARVLKSDQPILNAPWAAAQRRGSAALDARLPIFAVRQGEGCAARWLEIGPTAWVCEAAVALSSDPPVRADARVGAAGSDGLPFRYFFVGPDGSLGYKRLDAADVGEPDFELGPGFAVALVEERTVGGARYGRTNNGLWVPMRDLGAARSFAFRGAEIPEGESAARFGWVVAEKARVYAKPNLAAPTSASRARFEQVTVLDEVSSFAGKFTRVGDGAWIASKDLRHPTVLEPPAEVDIEAGERWIDIELSSQTLVAYEGRDPVFATLVSTGKGRPGTPMGTPTGVHRVWIKMLTSNMDNLEDDSAARYYRMEDVPWVQYFSKGVGLHGAFWHRSFGSVRSHGCVNLAPLDAQRLFWWTSPHLPAGWTATVPTSLERGAVIRVR